MDFFTAGWEGETTVHLYITSKNPYIIQCIPVYCNTFLHIKQKSTKVYITDLAKDAKVACVCI